MKKPSGLVLAGALSCGLAGIAAAEPKIEGVENLEPQFAALVDCMRARFGDFGVLNADGTQTFYLNQAVPNADWWREHIVTLSPDPAVIPNELWAYDVVPQEDTQLIEQQRLFSHPPTVASLLDFESGYFGSVNPELRSNQAVLELFLEALAAQVTRVVSACEQNVLAIDMAATEQAEAWALAQRNYESLNQHMQQCHWSEGQAPIMPEWTEWSFAEMFDDATLLEANEALASWQEEANLICPEA